MTVVVCLNLFPWSSQLSRAFRVSSIPVPQRAQARSKQALHVTSIFYHFGDYSLIPEQGSGHGRMVPFSSESVHDLGVGEWHLAMSLYKLKASVTYQLGT